MWSSNQLLSAIHPFQMPGVFSAFRAQSFCMHVVSRKCNRILVGLQCICFRAMTLVRALSLDVSWLLALVASTLVAGLRWAISAQMSNLSTVVALLSLGAVTAHVSVAAAGAVNVLAYVFLESP